MVTTIHYASRIDVNLCQERPITYVIHGRRLISVARPTLTRVTFYDKNIFAKLVKIIDRCSQALEGPFFLKFNENNKSTK